jgi:hypothetical protein
MLMIRRIAAFIQLQESCDQVHIDAVARPLDVSIPKLPAGG